MIEMLSNEEFFLGVAFGVSVSKNRLLNDWTNLKEIGTFEWPKSAYEDDEIEIDNSSCLCIAGGSDRKFLVINLEVFSIEV